MFGKGKKMLSGNDKFVMAMGRKAGNLKGNGTRPKTAPKQGKSPMKNANILPPGDTQPRGKSLGKVGTL